MEHNKMSTTLLRKIVNAFPPSWSKIPLALVYYMKNGQAVKMQKRRVEQYEKLLKRNGEFTPKKKAFFKTLKSYCLYMNRAGADKYINSYFENDDFRCLKRTRKKKIAANDVIMICCVKNDLKRIKAVYQHHKNIGVNNFVFVDNMSDDGTIEWLLNQDVDIYQTKEKYHAGAKSAWVRKVQEIYGFNRWYLIIDSDELFSYIGMEEHPIIELIQYAETNRILRVRSFLLDMYTNGVLFQNLENPDDFVTEFRYFDANSYYFENDCRGIMLRGGPRKRVFEKENDYAQPLTKYPLLFVTDEDVWADHTPMPFEKNFSSDCLSVLRHFKFLPEDKKKFYKIAKDGNYAKGSYEYKNYIQKTEQNSQMSFYYDGSAEYISSESLNNLTFIKAVFS